MAKYLKRGILCLMAFLSLFVLFTSFCGDVDRDIFEQLEFVKNRYGSSWKSVLLTRRGWARGIWFIIAGYDNFISSYYWDHESLGTLFKTDFANFTFFSLFWVELLGAIALCGLSAIVFIKGDNGIFSNIIMFGSIVIILLYCSQAFIYVFKLLFIWNPEFTFFEKVQVFFKGAHYKRINFWPLLLLLINAILCAGYFFVSKRLPSEE